MTLMWTSMAKHSIPSARSKALAKGISVGSVVRRISSMGGTLTARTGAVETITRDPT